MSVVESFGLGVSYRGNWALRDCSLSVPAGHIVALVGSNGAGKTTLLHCVVGLTTPTVGEVTVLGGVATGSPGARERVAFVAQEAPLYRHVSVRAMLTIAANLNQHFDRNLAEARLATLDIPLDRRVGRLSGGQQAQLALALALARQPDLLVLDEPLARLDPLARHEVMSVIMSSVAEGRLSVIFSSHVISELERVADFLILMSHGRIQMIGVIDDLLAGHLVLSGPTDEADRVVEQFVVIQSQHAGRQSQFVVRANASAELPGGWVAENISLDELVLAYLREPSATALSGPLAVSGSRAGRNAP